MGYLPYQLVQDFWAINSRIDILDNYKVETQALTVLPARTWMSKMSKSFFVVQKTWDRKKLLLRNKN